MPLKLQKNERLLLGGFVAVIALILILVLIAAPTNEDDPGFPSSTSAHTNGALAAYLTLQESGYSIARWYSAPSELPSQSSNATLILAEPFYVMQQEDKTEIARFLSGGGRVLAIGWAAGELIPRHSVIGMKVPRTEWKATSPAVPSRVTRGGPFKADQSLKWEITSADEIVQYASEDGPAVITYRYGKGEVIWWASSVPIRNGGIREAGNLELLVNSIGEPGTQIYWDEYFHSSHRSLLGTVADTPLKFFGWQFLLFSLMLIFTYSRRSGPLRPLPEQPRVSTMEFIETLGGLYERFRTPGVAVEVAYERFRQLLMRRTGVRTDAPPELAAKVVHEKLRYADDHLVENLRQYQAARYNHELTNADALRMVQQISQYQELLVVTKVKGEH